MAALALGRRMRPLAAALAVLALVLAGCVGGGEGMTAKDAAARGLDRARQWQPDAEMTGLAGFELRNASLARGGPFGFGIVSHDGPLDGRAPAWFLGYASRGAIARLGLVVFSNGTILANEGVEAGTDVAVRSWEVDSPRVLEVLSSHAELGPIVRAADASAGLFLVTPESNVSDPLWNFFVHAGSLGKAAQGAVGARAGDLLAVRIENLTDDGFGRTFPEPRTYQASGEVSPSEPEALEPFAVLAGHSQLSLTLSLSGRLPTDGGEFAVLDPAGAEVEAESMDRSGDGPFVFATGTYRLGEPGTYTLAIRYVSQAPAVPVPGPQQTDYDADLFVN